MGDFNTWGWKGLKNRALEFPAGSITEVSPTGRARVRYNETSNTLEASLNGVAYGPLDVVSAAGALTQTTWYIDAVSGSDNNDGATPGTALQSLRGYADKIGSGFVPVLQTVNILTDLTEGKVVLRGAYQIGLIFQGQTTTIRSGTVTGTQLWAAAAMTDGQITDAGVADWTADVGRGILLTSGASAGAFGWVGSDLGGGDTCRFSPLWDQNAFDTADPAIGNDYDVIELTTVDANVWLDTTGFVQFQDIHFTVSNFLGAINAANGELSMVRCQLSGNGGEVWTAGVDNFTQCVGCYLHSGFVKIADPECFFSGTMVGGRMLIQNGGRLIIAEDCLWQSHEGPEIFGGSMFEIRIGRIMGVYDMPGASDIALNMRVCANGFVTGTIFGTGNNGATAIGLHVDTGANLGYVGDAADRFGLAGAALTEVNLAGDVTVTYAGLSTTGSNGTNTVRNAAIAPASFL